uniref:Uncharacterized protein n=1 Tax=Picea sitchensis TaxID=3332 RepID=A0A6B9XYK9_PICSI|nr:hypothetical protein Q903MT_gene5743 [Picea sitchensis]
MPHRLTKITQGCLSGSLRFLQHRTLSRLMSPSSTYIAPIRGSSVGKWIRRACRTIIVFKEWALISVTSLCPAQSTPHLLTDCFSSLYLPQLVGQGGQLVMHLCQA